MTLDCSLKQFENILLEKINHNNKVFIKFVNQIHVNHYVFTKDILLLQCLFNL